jgi:hypothetical protein
MPKQRKLIVFEQTDPSIPIKVTIVGTWKAKEITQVERLLILAYRKQKGQIRREERIAKGQEE